MDLICFCGIAFPTVKALYDHATSRGHRIKCCCGTLLKTDTQLKNHHRSVDHRGVNFRYTKLKALHGLPGHGMELQDHKVQPTLSIQSMRGSPDTQSLACHACNGRTFKDAKALNQHTRDKHPACPICLKAFYDKYKKGTLRSAHEQLFAHQQTTGHCYCAEHEVAFDTEDHFRTHQLTIDSLLRTAKSGRERQ